MLNTVLPPPGPRHADISRRRLPPKEPPLTIPREIPGPRPSTADLPHPPDIAANSHVRPVLRMLSEEIGLPLESLKDDLVFSDYGVDSLLSLTIVGRIREELEVNIDSSVFVTCGTLGQFTALFDADGSPGASTSSSSSMMSGSDSSALLTTPEDVSMGAESHDSSLISKVCASLAEEIGVSVSEVVSSSDLGELGLDSLSSLSILGRLREELDLNLEADFFTSHQSFASVQVALTNSASSEGVMEERPRADPSTSSSFSYHATSTLLQGSPKKAKHVLFLFPDGSGSATSYATVNEVSPDVCIYGLNCPWLKSAENLAKYGLKVLATLYVTEIRRRQPHGPYNLGGWSAGGICAYEAALQLTREGETVDNLVLLDSPGPIGLEKLPPRLFDFLNGQGVFGEEGRSAPDWLLGHFLAFIDALDAYEPIPWETAVRSAAGGDPPPPPPRTHLIWAEDGVCKREGDVRPEYRDDDPREMRWLLENRTDFGPNGWDVLLGRDNISIDRIPNANHFTMLRRGDATKKVASFLKDVFRP